jgi:dipeptidase
MNEWGVSIGTDACPSREEQTVVDQGRIGYMLRRIVAERAKTAREGVIIAGELLDKLGYASSGRTMAICDAEEGWLLSIAAGKHWVAQRVPDDEVAVLPNTYIIRQVDFTDSENYITSKNNIRDYAIQKGWYDPKSGKPFDFAYAYMRIPDPDDSFFQRGYDTRQWRGQHLFTGDTVSVEEAKENGLPFSVKPNRKLTVQDVIAVLRDHYEGTQYGPASVQKPVFISTDGECTVCRGLPREIVVNPNHIDERTISYITTQFSTVAQLRNTMPDPIGSVLWTCIGRPDCGVYVPWYTGISSIPEGYHNTPGITCPDKALAHQFDPVPGTYDYDPSAAFWVFNDLENLVDAHYPDAIAHVKPVWESFENQAFHMQKSIETVVLKEWKKNPEQVNAYLTQYTLSLCQRTVNETQRLINTLKTKFYH